MNLSNRISSEAEIEKIRISDVLKSQTSKQDINPLLDTMHIKKIDTYDNLILNIPSQDRVIINFDKKNDIFTIYDDRNVIIGSFGIGDILQYLHNKNSSISHNLIDKLIFYVDKNNEIHIRSPTDSPFVGDLDLLMKLNNGISNYEKYHLDNDITKHDTTTKKKIKILYQNLTCSLSHHILKIISIISNEIKSDDSKKELKDKMLRYSVSLTYRLGSLIKKQIDANIEKVEMISESISKMLEIKEKMINSIRELDDKISLQNEILKQANSSPKKSISSEIDSKLIENINKNTTIK